ncbi:glycosyltransferase 87 family protein [Pedococcus sp. NPDC057267]|uniref:glycosyltransferase 87 family protein n=1 Tax=Pedococcus sp. NPDC057267 TaxID=3346077 RepID=UPI00363D72F7
MYQRAQLKQRINRIGNDAKTTAHRLRRFGEDLPQSVSTASRPGRSLILAVFSLAILVRLAPLLWTSALTGESDMYDDGVYFAAAQHLVAGQLPYRDFVMVHPPGIAVAMAPFAALGHVIGDGNAFAAARLLLMAVGAVNAVLVTWIAGRQGVVAGAVGGLLYAVWWPAASAETTVFLEPILNLLLLLAVGLLTGRAPSPRRTAAAGLLMGASVSVKLWPAPVLVVLVVWLFRTRGLREARRFAVGCAVSLVAVLGPFFMFAPRQMWSMVVLDQVSRTNVPSAEQSIADRLLPFAGASSHLDTVVPAGVVYLVSAAALVGIVLLVRAVPGGLLWFCILCTQLVELLLSSNYYGTHYPAFAAASLAVLCGLAAGRGLQLLRHGVRLRLTGALTMTVLLVFLASSTAIGVRRGQEGAVDNSALRSFAHGHRCVFTSSTVAIIADQESRNIDHRCGYQVDLFGLFLEENRSGGTGGKTVSKLSVPAWQQHVQEEIVRSDAVILNLKYEDWETWTPATRSAFLSRFKNAGRIGLLQLWEVDRS